MSDSENVKLTESPMTTTAGAPTTQTEQQVKLVDVPVTNENTALNVMVQFLNLAQRRGAYGIDEAAKIYECFRMFTKGDESAAASMNTTTSLNTTNSM